MDLGLRGKKAIVTGGTRGIGRAVANLLAEEGCDIATCARSADGIRDAVSAFKAKGVRAFGKTVDVADGSQLVAFIESAAVDLGGVDIFISNVGAMGGANDEASWRRGFEIDLLGMLRGCETAVPFLETSGAGALVVIGSTAAVELIGARRAYNSMKAAILPYVKGLARELAPKNVRANVVSPGTIYFPGGIWNVREQKAPEAYRNALQRNPMGRMGTPEEVANAAVFLASPRASFITGVNLICDGALTQRVQF